MPAVHFVKETAPHIPKVAFGNSPLTDTEAENLESLEAISKNTLNKTGTFSFYTKTQTPSNLNISPTSSPKEVSKQFDEQELNTWKTAAIALGSALAALSLGMGATLCYCFCRKTSSQTPRLFELTSTSDISSSADQLPRTESERVPSTTQESV